MSALGDVAGRGLPSDAVGLAKHLIGYIKDDKAVAAHVLRETGRFMSSARVAELRRKAQPRGGG